MRKAFIVLASLAGMAAIMPAWAQADGKPGRPPDKAIGLSIADRDRDAVYNYYHVGHTEAGAGPRSGHVNKVWAIGRPLPDDVIYHPLPAVLLGQLTSPPVGYEYVRVGSDVLLMAMGTRIVAGAVADLANPDDAP